MKDGPALDGLFVWTQGCLPAEPVHDVLTEGVVPRPKHPSPAARRPGTMGAQSAGSTRANGAAFERTLGAALSKLTGTGLSKGLTA